jgi:uncharacterized protein (UPF0332 family)
MAQRPSNSELLLICKGDAKSIQNFGFGIYAHNKYGHDLDALLEQATRDRFQFAQENLKWARSALSGSDPKFRMGLARAYYAMYHAARAVVFLVERGDDFQAHSELPKHLPQNFPNRAQWENNLKNARLERNRADYDPYPKADRTFSDASKLILQSAENFLPLARRYLVQRGCRV